jgi:hypothetical protein
MHGLVVVMVAGSLALRDKVLDLEAVMQGVDEVTDWSDGTRHHFGEGTYVREVRRAADSLIVGKIHRHSCVNILMVGQLVIESEHESGVYEAPAVWVSPAGNKRAIYYVTDSHWMTIHGNPSNTRDLEVLESELIAESYAALEAV